MIIIGGLEQAKAERGQNRTLAILLRFIALPTIIEEEVFDFLLLHGLEDLYDALTGQFRRYMGHVTKNVGGVYENPKTYDMAGNAYEVTPSAIQNEAVAFLNEQLFKTPTWLLNQNIISKIKGDVGVDAIKSMQDATLSSLLSNDRLVRLIDR